MRWLYLDPPRPEDVARRDEALVAIENFWQAFLAQQGEIESFLQDRQSFDLASWLEQHLQGVHPELMWEIGRGEPEGWRLTITPEDRLDLRPLVDTLIENRPPVSGWSFLPFRPPDRQYLQETVQARTGHDSRGLRGTVRRMDGNLLEVGFHLPLVPEPEAAGQAAFLAAETLFGEENLALWIGGVGYATDESVVEDWMEPDELVEAFEALRSEIRKELPEEPRYKLRDQVPWHAIEFDPDEEEDYPGRQDLIGFTTMELEAFKAAHGVGPFCSSRFSLLGETFCYLKIERPSDAYEDTVELRSQLEEDLHQALSEAGLGGQVGGGTGLRYSYVDLALLDVRNSIPVLRRVLRDHDVPNRSWLLFFDETLKSEWVGGRGEESTVPVPPGFS